MSESALLRRVVESLLLATAAVDSQIVFPIETVAATGRISVRLRHHDLVFLRERARARELPTSTYVSYLVRTHLRAQTPLPTAELEALKRSVAEVGAIGRNINQIARAVNQQQWPAVRGLASEQFGLKHRYALTLHTDEAHPHVHLVVKAVSEQGERLNIRKATLRDWRQLFATHLRAQGIAANATERAVRGQTRTPKSDAIYRAMRRNESVHELNRRHDLAKRAPTAVQSHVQGKAKLERTRALIVAGWHAVADRLGEEGEYQLVPP